MRRDSTSPKEGEVQVDVKVDSEPEQLLRTFKLKFTGDAWTFCLFQKRNLSTNPSHLPFLNQTWQRTFLHFSFHR